MNRKLSVTEYATLRGISRQAVLAGIRDKREMAGVKACEKVGNTYVLTVAVKVVQNNS